MITALALLGVLFVGLILLPEWEYRRAMRGVRREHDEWLKKEATHGNA